MCRARRIYHKSKTCPMGLNGFSSNILTVQEYLTSRRIEEPLDQVDRTRLPRSRTTDKCHVFSRSYEERHIIKCGHFWSRVVV